MKNQFTPLELALRLKDLGFNETCIAFYDNEDLMIIHLLAMDLNNAHFDKYEGGSKVTAPLWQQAFDWLLEKNDYQTIPVIRKTLDGKYHCSGEKYDMLTSAKEAMVLRLIKLCKKK